MRSHDEIPEKVGSQAVIFSDDAVSEAFQIEDVLNRAHEIHRARGGLFGYDLEDWLEAEREVAEKKRADEFRVEETVDAGSGRWNQGRN
jgi:hypothetical protein